MLHKDNNVIVEVPLKALERMAIAMQDASERLDYKGTNGLSDCLQYLESDHSLLGRIVESAT